MKKFGTATSRGRSMRLIAGMSALAIVLVACGGGDGEDPDIGESPGEETASPEDGGTETGDDGASAEGEGESALAGSWDEIVAAAEEEGSLVISAHRGSGFEEWCAEVTNVMGEEYNITVDCSAQSPSDWTGRVVAEQQSGEYLWDVFAGAISNVHLSLKPAGGTQALDPWMEALPEEVRQDDDWHQGFGVYSDEDNEIFIHQYDLSGGTYVNTDEAPDISEPEDLLDPELEGRLVGRDATNVNGGSMTLTWFLNQEDTFGEEGVRQLIHDQQITFVESPDTMLEWLADGRAAVGFGASPDDLEELQAAGIGENIEVFDFGQYLIAYGTAVMTNNPNPNATAVFLNWHLSQEGQQAWVDLTSVTASSRRKDVEPPNPDMAPDYTNLDAYPPVIGTEEGNRLVETVTEIALE